MRIDFPNSFKSAPVSESDLLRPASNDRSMQEIAILHAAVLRWDDLGKKFKKNAVYLGLWPMYYAEVILLNDQGNSLDDRLNEFVEGMAFGIANSRREHKHIILQEAILFWDYLHSANHVSETKTVDMLRALIDEMSRRPQFGRTLADLFCLNHPNMVEEHKPAQTVIDAFLLQHTDVAEAMFKTLKGSFLKAMNTFNPAVWKPYCQGSARIEMQLGRDLGI